jgi:hypothetical protein
MGTAGDSNQDDCTLSPIRLHKCCQSANLLVLQRKGVNVIWKLTYYSGNNTYHTIFTALNSHPRPRATLSCATSMRCLAS